MQYPPTKAYNRVDREQKIVHFMTETSEGRAILHKLFDSEMPYWLATDAGQEWMDKIAEDVIMEARTHPERYGMGGDQQL